MNLEYYQYLIHLAEAGSLAKAASELYISPQGLSKAMHQMGAELGTPMFYSARNGMQLSAAGKEVYLAAKQIVSINEILKEKLHPYTDKEQFFDFLIYSSPHTVLSFMQKSIRQFYKENPRAKIKFIEMHPWEMCSQKDCQKNVLRFLSFPEPWMDMYLKQIGNDFSFHRLFSAPIMYRVSNKSPLSVRKVITSEYLEKSSLAFYAYETDLTEMLFGEEFKSRIGINSSNYSLMIELISKDVSMVGVTDTLIEKHLNAPQVKAIPIEPCIETIYGYVLHKDVQKNAMVSELLDIIGKNI